MKGSRRPLFRAGLVALALAAISAISSGAMGASGASGDGPDVDLSHPRYKTRIKRQWGVDIGSVRVIAGGYLLAFRYRVIDAEKAAPVFERRSKPRLMHEESGAEFIVPAPEKTGPLRNSNSPQEGRIYWMAFANPGKYIQPGDHVTITIGEFRASHLVVQ